MGEQIWNLLAVIGGIRVGFWAWDKAQELYIEYKQRKSRRQAQKSRLNSYRHGYGQKPISIAKEYAEDLRQTPTENKRPIRMATGFYSDANAQKYLI